MKEESRSLREAHRPPGAIPDESPEIRIGVSSCLLGEEVRWDGGHKRDTFVSDLLSKFFTFVPVCPELEMGLGVPRETLRLVRSDGLLRLVAPKSGTDHTERMERWTARRLRELGALDLSGYILKKNSPSCGLERVRTYDPGGTRMPNDRGLYAARLMEAFPLLPVEEEGRLNDPALRENFIERVFAGRRLRNFFSRRWTVGALVAFHTREKLLLLSHDEPVYRELGRLVARARQAGLREVADRYQHLFLKALGRLATRTRQTNVLQHAAGHLKTLLTPEDRFELTGVIEDYRRGLVPLIVPMTLLRHHVRRYGVATLLGQSWLEPHPKELMLRNHA